MKNKLVCLLVVSLLWSSCFVLCVSAEGMPEAVGSGYEAMLSSLPDAVRDLLPRGMFSESSDEVAGAVDEMLSLPFVFGVISETVGLHIGAAVGLLLRIVGILILSGLFHALSRALRGDAGGRTLHIMTSMAILLAVVGEQNRLFSALQDYFSSLSLLAGSMIPLMGGLYAIGGNLSGAATGSTMMSIFLAVSELIGGKLLIPTVGMCIALATVPVLAPTLNLRSLLSCMKRCFTFSLGFMMMLLSALLAMRSGLAAKADSISARTVKYVASSVIPVVGGSIADSLRTVGAGVELLRTTLGVAGMILIVLLLLPFLIDVLLFRLALIFSASAAEVIGCETEAKLLHELVGVYGYILAVSAMCAMMFVFALTILARTASAIG